MVGDSQSRPRPGRIAAGGPEVIPAASQLRHWRVDGEQVFRGHRPQRDHSPGLDNRDLAEEEWRASVALVTLRGAVSRRAALDHVGDVDIFAAHAHGLDHVIQQLASASHEGLSLRIFIRTWALAHKH